MLHQVFALQRKNIILKFGLRLHIYYFNAECLEDSIKPLDEKKGTPLAYPHSSCLAVLSSKSGDETLVSNFIPSTITNMS